ncbi:MAG: ABC transporter ATP-binding protein [Alphaproteobacteria bacterium]|nr:ABC transporter ATP-binding protein [Alphaproteobacteria bacterium]
MLRVERIESGYGRTRILHAISIALHPGEVVAVVGPNGAGKTTLLRTISGLATVHGGDVFFRDERITGLRADKVVARGIAHCPEGRRIFQRLTIEENLLAAHLPGRSKPFGEAVEAIYAMFPVLKERRASPASRLSGGQQQMLAIGRALMAEPELLILDEPSLGLAPKVVNQILEIILQLAERGISVLVVEQNVTAAMQISDYAYVIETGRCVMEGPSAKLLAAEDLREVYLPKV